ncbi:MAG: multiheme c-type cytochrome [Planctomycetota bacterium]
MMRSLLISSLLIAVAGGLLVPSCRQEDRSAGGEGASKPPKIEAGLFMIGNDHGMIRPCGCAKPVLGGIERRAGFFEGIDKAVMADSLVLAFGDLVIDAGRQQEMKLEIFMQSMTALGVKAFCPGDGDLQVGSSFWTDLVQLAEFPFVSLNLMRGEEPLFTPFVVIPWRGVKLHVTGYVSPTDNKLNEPSIAAVPEPDTKDLLASLKTAGDVGHLLFYSTATDAETRSYLGRSGLSAAAAKTMVALRSVSDIPVLLSDTDGVPVVEFGQKGRDVAWTSWPKASTVRGYTLDEKVGVGDFARELLSFYRQMVDDEDLLENEPRIHQAEGPYAGSKTCATCHPKAHEVWAASRHAHAFQSLIESGDQKDPECVRCHVVDFDRRGGFDASTMSPVNVQCEACHGPAAGHAAQPLTKTPRGVLGPRFCFKCHDLANSPKFEFDDYWPRIVHRGH